MGKVLQCSLCRSILHIMSHYRCELFTHVHYFVHLNLCIAMFFAFGLFLFVDLAIGKKVSYLFPTD